MKTFILDNYDSFTFNLFQLVAQIDEPPAVIRNDALSFEALAESRPDRIILSPGPGRPEDPARFGIGVRVIRELGRTIPILGVCLGHQGIVHAFGGRIVKSPRPMHGKRSLITHDGEGIYQGLPPGFEAMRYHSLVAEPKSLPACLKITATTLDGVIMGVRHQTLPIEGVQFHPESIGTSVGHALVSRFLLERPALRATG